MLSEHKSYGEAQHILAAVKDEALVAGGAEDVGRVEPVGDVVEAILEGEVKVDARDVDAEPHHEAEVDGVDALGEVVVGGVLEVVDAVVGEHKLGFGTDVER